MKVRNKRSPKNANTADITPSQWQKPTGLALRNSRGAPVDAYSLTATEAKNGFGRLLETVIRGGIGVITKHDTPKAVLISFEDFTAFAHTSATKLDILAAEFDALLSRMQTPKARAGQEAAFGASPKQLGKAALKYARKRG